MAGLSDSELVRKAEQFRRLKELEAAAAAEVRAAQDELLVELDRRQAPALVIRGLRITKVTGTRTTYLVDAARALLRPGLFRKVTAPAIVKDAFEAQVAAGVVTDDQRDQITSTTPTAPYVRVSGSAA